MSRFSLNVAFKGDRDYIQGPDIFDECLRVLREEGVCQSGELDLAFHAFSRTRPVMFLSEEPRESEHVNANFSCRGSDEGVSGVIVAGDEQVVERVAYDENRLLQEFHFDSDFSRATLPMQSEFTLMEQFVSINKRMHQMRFEGITGKWILSRCRVQAGQWNGESGLLCVHLVRALGTRLTESVVSVDGREMGKIYFSLI